MRRRAIELLDAAGDLWALPRVEEMLRDPDGGVRSAALLFLAHHAPLDPLTRIQELDGFQDVSVLSGIVAFLAPVGRPRARSRRRGCLMDRLIAERGRDGRRSRLEAAG